VKRASAARSRSSSDAPFATVPPAARLADVSASRTRAHSGLEVAQRGLLDRIEVTGGTEVDVERAPVAKSNHVPGWGSAMEHALLTALHQGNVSKRKQEKRSGSERIKRAATGHATPVDIGKLATSSHHDEDAADVLRFLVHETGTRLRVRGTSLWYPPLTQRFSAMEQCSPATSSVVLLVIPPSYLPLSNCLSLCFFCSTLICLLDPAVIKPRIKRERRERRQGDRRPGVTKSPHDRASESRPAAPVREARQVEPQPPADAGALALTHGGQRAVAPGTPWRRRRRTGSSRNPRNNHSQWGVESLET